MIKEIKVLDKGYVRYIDHMGSDARICEAARVSYRAPSKGIEQDKKLLDYLYRKLHTSPFEQCQLTLNIKLPLFVQAQLVRHRTQKLNQVSARYTEMKDEFYIPDNWRKQDTKNKQGSVEDGKWDPILREDVYSGSVWNATSELKNAGYLAYDLYKNLIKAGVAREMARMVLPQNLYTEIYTTWDLNNLMRMLQLRLDSHAQWEIREYAKAIFNIFKEVYPITAAVFEKYEVKVIERVDPI